MMRRRSRRDPTSTWWRAGLPGSSSFLPTVAEVRAACEALVEGAVRANARIAREQAQLAERRALDAYYRAVSKTELQLGRAGVACAGSSRGNSL